MQTLNQEESRKILDAMGVPVVVLKNRLATVKVCDLSTNAGLRVASEESGGRPIRRQSKVSDESSLTLERTPAVATESRTTNDSLVDAPGLVSSEEEVLLETSAGEPTKAFSLVTAIAADAMILVELPGWANGLLDGRLSGVISDILRVVSANFKESDWQYFSWPIRGMSDESHEAAMEAVDAWFHRRFAEMTGSAPPIILAATQVLDAKQLDINFVLLPPIEQIVTNVEVKRAVWTLLQSNYNVTA